MAIVKKIVRTNSCVPSDSCGDVVICLPLVDWAARTTDGSGLIFGTIAFVGKYSNSVTSNTIDCGSTTCSSFGTSCSATGNTCDSVGYLYEYCVSYDDDQFIVNPDSPSGAKYELPCDVSLFGNPCIIENLKAFISTNGGTNTFGVVETATAPLVTTNGANVAIGEEYILFPNGDSWGSLAGVTDTSGTVTTATTNFTTDNGVNVIVGGVYILFPDGTTFADDTTIAGTVSIATAPFTSTNGVSVAIGEFYVDFPDGTTFANPVTVDTFGQVLTASAPLVTTNGVSVAIGEQYVDFPNGDTWGQAADTFSTVETATGALTTTNGVSIAIGEQYIALPNGDTWGAPPEPQSTISQVVTAGNQIALHDDGLGNTEFILETVTTVTPTGNGAFTFTDEAGNDTQVPASAAGDVQTATAPLTTTNGISVAIGETYIVFPNGDTWASDGSGAGANEEQILVTHTAHGLGATGAIIPVKPSSTAGEYEIAGYTDLSDTASHVAVVVDANSYTLFDSGFFTLTGHGFTVNTLYSGHTSGFIPSASVAITEILQNAFIAYDANTLYINLEEAQAFPDLCSETVIDATGDAIMLAALAATITAGTLIVTADGGATSGYRPAEAEDEVIFVAEPFLLGAGPAPDSFKLRLNGSIPDAISLADTSLVAIPNSQVVLGGTIGTLVANSSLANGDTRVFVGNTTSDDCLHINVGPAEVVSGQQQALTPDFSETFTGGTFDNTYASTPSVVTFRTATDGKEYCHRNYDCLSPSTGSEVADLSITATNHLRVEWIVGWENINSNIQGMSTDIGRFFTNSGGTVSADWTTAFGGSTPGQFRFDITNYPTVDTGVVPVSNALYRVTIEIRLNTADGSNDGYLNMKVEKLVGSITSGTNFQVSQVLYNDIVDPYNSNSGSSPVDFDRVRQLFFARDTWVCTDTGIPGYAAMLRMFGYDLS